LSFKVHIPNLLTSGNLLCGFLGVIQIMQGDLTIACYFIWMAAFFDFIDGFSARFFKVDTVIGKDLDSLADMVTFGLLPALILFTLLEQLSSSSFIPYLAFLITVFSAVRLARFNVSEQNAGFIGLPTPANGILISSFPFIIDGDFGLVTQFLSNPIILAILTIILSILLIANVPMFSLKFKNYSWANNKVKYIFILCSILLFTFFQLMAIPFIVLLYIILSISNKFVLK